MYYICYCRVSLSLIHICDIVGGFLDAVGAPDLGVVDAVERLSGQRVGSRPERRFHNAARSAEAVSYTHLKGLRPLQTPHDRNHDVSRFKSGGVEQILRDVSAPRLRAEFYVTAVLIIAAIL